MKYLLFIVLLTGCSGKTIPDPKFTPEGNKFWSEYSEHMQGKCFHNWDGQDIIVSIDDVNKIPTWIGICYLNRMCDSQNKNKCIVHKTCSDFMHSSELYDKIQADEYRPMKCVRSK